MASTEELEAQILADMESDPEAYADTEIEYCTVDDDTRLVTIPDKYKKLGVESDEKAKRIWFKFPKLVGNNGIDLSAICVRVNFRNANGDGDIYIVEDLTTDGDYVTFSWELTRKVTAYKGHVSFVVCAVKSATDGTIKNEWNTTLNKECEVLEGLEVTEQIAQENPDIIEYILANLGGSVSAEQIAQAVESYLVENPPSGMTADEKAQLNKNTEDISSLSEEIADLKENGTSTGTGLTQAQITALDGMFKVSAYDPNKDYSGAYEVFKQAFGINVLYEWDFTKKSMTDTKQGVTLTSSNTTLDSDGLHLTADNSHVSNFGIDLRNKTIELELGTCNLDTFTSARWMLLLQRDETSNDRTDGIKLDVDTETIGLNLETPNGVFKPDPIISDYSVLSNNTIGLRFTETTGTTPWTQISMLLGGSVIVENKNYRTAEYAVYPSIGYSSARCPHQVTIKKIRIMVNE